jgi:hypothetical protein
MDSPDFDTRLSASMTNLQTQVIASSQCLECGRPWLIETERWRLKVLDAERPESALYCPACHAREFERP